MTTPRVDPQATAEVLRMGSYPYFLICGSATEVIVAAVAVFEPHIAAKPAHAMTVAIAKPPLTRPIHVLAVL